MKEKKERQGYNWIETSSGGYWSKVTGPHHSHKLPLFCPVEDCQRPSGTIDDDCFEKFGICSTCYVMKVEDRQKPLLDVDFYRKRLQERGF
jgi:hypothetical protein